MTKPLNRFHEEAIDGKPVREGFRSNFRAVQRELSELLRHLPSCLDAHCPWQDFFA